jgi:signal peptidase I
MFDDNPFIQGGVEKKDSNVFIDLLQTVVIALSICVVIYLFIATPNEVLGQSMEPTFYDGELLLTNKMMQLFGDTSMKKIVGDYQRGDVVIFKSDTPAGDDFIKRIIAVEGDEVMVQDGHVYVNGNKLEEKYLPPGRRTEQGPFFQESIAKIVPEGHYVVFGDNRNNSTDSRSNIVGFVKRTQLKGKVFFRYWPLDKFGVISGYDYKFE